jgi:hypothetical protein
MPLQMLSSQFTLELIRHTCAIFGGKTVFGFDPHEIGNRSIRSGAAMALFLKDHSTAKIMILGRWSSNAFLVYIRPKVLEWTNNMSKDMVSFNSFLDVGLYDVASNDDPRNCRRTLRLTVASAPNPYVSPAALSHGRPKKETQRSPLIGFGHLDRRVKNRAKAWFIRHSTKQMNPLLDPFRAGYGVANQGRGKNSFGGGSVALVNRWTRRTSTAVPSPAYQSNTLVSPSPTRQQLPLNTMRQAP